MQPFTYMILFIISTFNINKYFILYIMFLHFAWSWGDYANITEDSILKYMKTLI